MIISHSIHILLKYTQRITLKITRLNQMPGRLTDLQTFLYFFQAGICLLKCVQSSWSYGGTECIGSVFYPSHDVFPRLVHRGKQLVLTGQLPVNGLVIKQMYKEQLPIKSPNVGVTLVLEF